MLTLKRCNFVNKLSDFQIQIMVFFYTCQSTQQIGTYILIYVIVYIFKKKKTWESWIEKNMVNQHESRNAPYGPLVNEYRFSFITSAGLDIKLCSKPSILMWYCASRHYHPWESNPEFPACKMSALTTAPWDMVDVE